MENILNQIQNTISTTIQNNINTEYISDTFNSLIGNDTLAQFISEVRKCKKFYYLRLIKRR
jgi:hypothetical protein